MILKRFYNEKLAQASYLVGCQAAKAALVVDPNRDVQQYLDAAAAAGVKITHVTETHIHADFVSGARELARAAGATLLLSAEGGADWQYAFAAEDGATLLRDGDSFSVGKVRFDVMHTPGHTPEHIIFLVTDTEAADRPIGALTGAFVFVGDVGRPDLLEKAARVEGTMDASARALFRSLQRFKSQPDWLQVWPGHGAGSACGKGLSAMPHSTVGYEKLFNHALSFADEDAFVADVLRHQPEPPRYFATMKRVNRDGPTPRPTALPERLPAAQLGEAAAAGALVVDTRATDAFARGFVPGTINVPLNKAFPTWAGSLIPADRDFRLVVDPARLAEAVGDLALIGLERVAGWWAPEDVEAWRAAGGRAGSVAQVDPAEVARVLEEGEAAVVDVRGAAEWEAGHLPGVPNIPLGYLPDRLAELPRDRPVVVQCQGGARSAIAASVLKAHGFDAVSNMSGGYSAWAAAGLPVEVD
ncbi:MAG TPA: rhodanese-like domain-containing protein [Longimicrobium sp.]|nr:rhodanese-like domain-containing protein [Longimicrobium sp.]